MRKRNSSKASIVSNANDIQATEAPNSVTKSGLFTFSNGDKYEGEYAIFVEPPFLARQGRGVYDTEDFETYECVWNRDRIATDLHIRFNNGTRFKGDLDEDGKISGQGTYFLSDGSSISAEWKGNKLFRDIRYKEPLGFTWNGEICEEEKVLFSPGNHFWDDMKTPDDQKSSDNGKIPEN